MKRRVRNAPRQRRIQLGYLGLVVSLWNELEPQVRTVLVTLSPDRLTASWLAADLQIGPLINATRLMSKEIQWMHERINVTLRRKRGRYKLFEPFTEHVDHYLNGVDILREHRNYYIHYAVADRSDRKHLKLQISKLTARGRVSYISHPIEETALENLSFQITDYLTYGDSLLEALEKNVSKKFFERPSWPEKPPLPERLKMTHITLQDALLPRRSSPA
jgi:hypothetical protein